MKEQSRKLYDMKKKTFFQKKWQLVDIFPIKNLPMNYRSNIKRPGDQPENRENYW